MEMTNEEIVRSYLQAKNPRKQISILADLNLCSVSEIRRILKEGGVDHRKLPRNKKSSEKQMFRLQDGAIKAEEEPKSMLPEDAPENVNESLPAQESNEYPQTERPEAFRCPALDGEPALTTEEAELCPACRERAQEDEMTPAEAVRADLRMAAEMCEKRAYAAAARAAKLEKEYKAARAYAQELTSAAKALNNALKFMGEDDDDKGENKWNVN